MTPFKKSAIPIILTIVIIVQLFFLYSLPNQLEKISIFYKQIHWFPENRGIVFRKLIYIATNLIGILGIIQYFRFKNFFNKYLKLFILFYLAKWSLSIPHTFIHITFLRTTSPDWLFYFFTILKIVLLIYSIKIYRQAAIRTKVLSSIRLTRAKRFVHHFVDSILIYIILFSYVRTVNTLSSDLLLIILLYVCIFSIPFLYYTFCEALFRQTPGKVVTNTYVSNPDGSPTSLKKILIRSLCRYIPFEALSYVVQTGERWHDKFSGTDVFSASTSQDETNSSSSDSPIEENQTEK